MSKIPRSQWTDAEKEFDKAVCNSESPNQLLRIEGRLALQELAKKYGKEELDRMWERIK